MYLTPAFAIRGDFSLHFLPCRDGKGEGLRGLIKGYLRSSAVAVQAPSGTGLRVVDRRWREEFFVVWVEGFIFRDVVSWWMVILVQDLF